MDSDIAIKVDHVSKSFKLPHEKSSSLKGVVVNVWSRKKGYEIQRALEDVSFEVKKGEFFGIVGRNGSGKSTMLKLLAGIYTPNRGNIQVQGKLTPFIELGVGFNPELTGRENVFLNGALLGFSRKEMAAMYDDIIDFAELERFMDQKLKNYSSGMQVRLAFSIAIRANGDILLLDEVLAVGDEAFQKKCFEYFAQLKEKKQTVVLVSHDMESVKRFCDSAVLLSRGKIVEGGNTAKVAEKYIDLNLQSFQENSEVERDGKQAHTNAAANPVEVVVSTSKKSSKSGKRTQFFVQEDTIEVRAQITLLDKTQTIENAEVGISIIDSSGKTVFIDSTTRKSMPGIDLRVDQYTATVIFSIYNIFSEGKYDISVAVLDLLMRKTYGRVDNQNSIQIVSKEKAGWLLKPPSDISYLT